MFEVASRMVASSNGVQVVVYDNNDASTPSNDAPAPSGGVSRPPILFSHATGFHGRVFGPVATHLREYSCTTFDYRGYGDTTPPANWSLDWDGFGDDALAVSRDLVERRDGRPLVAVGHSMGGAGVIMAALREPALFAALVVFEPIIFPPELRSSAPTGGTSRENPLADVTRRRRRSFPSYQAALDNFSSKPPLQSLHPDVLEAYVRFGFSQHVDGVHIKCDPEFEAQTYEMGIAHETWQLLGSLRVPTWVMSGAHIDHSPAAFAQRIAARIPSCAFVSWPDRGHFGPLEDPARFAGFISEVVTTISN